MPVESIRRLFAVHRRFSRCADMHQVPCPPTLSPYGVEEILVRTAEIEFPGLAEQAESQQRLFEAGQGLGAFLEGSVDIVTRTLVRSAFGP